MSVGLVEPQKPVIFISHFAVREQKSTEQTNSSVLQGRIERFWSYRIISGV